ncbi:MAG: AAA family ATPase [Saprospiraceae bacterium]
MQFNIENLGPIHQANIEINGLTVITGQNGIGKSYLGKGLFSVVDIARENFLYIRSFLYKQVGETIEEIIEELKPFPSLRYIEAYLDFLPIDDFLFNRNNVREELEEHKQQVLKEMPSEKNKLVKESFDMLNMLTYAKVLNSEEFNNERFKKSFSSITNSIFKGAINNKNNKRAATKITLKDSKTNTSIKIEVENNQLTHLETNSHFFKKVTSVESPLILTLHSFIRDSLAFNRGFNQNADPYQGLPYHIFDLVKKISQKRFTEETQLSNEIKSIISGSLQFDSGQDDFIYTDSNHQKHNILNVASGIKSFGLLQLLLASNNLEKGSLLIIDEPEVHLHPFWQLKYAEILIRLVEEGVLVVVTSHSPYFIEALKTYSDKRIKDKTKFYLGEMKEKGTIFKDATNNLEPIFELLAEPMQLLMFDN